MHVGFVCRFRKELQPLRAQTLAKVSKYKMGANFIHVQKHHEGRAV